MHKHRCTHSMAYREGCPDWCAMCDAERAVSAARSASQHARRIAIAAERAAERAGWAWDAMTVMYELCAIADFSEMHADHAELYTRDLTPGSSLQNIERSFHGAVDALTSALTYHVGGE